MNEITTSAEKDAEIARLTADSTYMAKLLVRFRDKLINVNDHVEDEGDRVYFGSTNDADDFKEVVATIDDFRWNVILDRSKGRDIYAEMRELRSRADAAEAEAATLRERLERAEQILTALFAAIDTGKMVERGAGGMTIDAQIKRSVYTAVPAWPVEEAREAYRALQNKEQANG